MWAILLQGEDLPAATSALLTVSILISYRAIGSGEVGTVTFVRDVDEPMVSSHGPKNISWKACANHDRHCRYHQGQVATLGPSSTDF